MTDRYSIFSPTGVRAEHQVEYFTKNTTSQNVTTGLVRRVLDTKEIEVIGQNVTFEPEYILSVDPDSINKTVNDTDEIDVG